MGFEHGYLGLVERYYDEHAHEEWERLERHRAELAVTLRALGEYLPPAAS